jgi:hypothetical protein
VGFPIVVTAVGATAVAQPAAVHAHAPAADAASTSAQSTGCTAEQRNQALREMQKAVLQMVPQKLAALDKAVQPGGPLAGWRLPHGLTVLASAGAVAVDNVNARGPMPQVLLYAPSPSSRASDWMDFTGADGPYQLVGWGYFAPYRKGGAPPRTSCVASGEWVVQEAGWHLRNGGMYLTPGATAEPPRPELKEGIYFWQPQLWNLHVWWNPNGVPTVAVVNPHRRAGGVVLPQAAFFQPGEESQLRPAAARPPGTPAVGATEPRAAQPHAPLP